MKKRLIIGLGVFAGVFLIFILAHFLLPDPSRECPHYIDMSLDREEALLEEMYVNRKEMTEADFHPEGTYLFDCKWTEGGDASVIYITPKMVMYLVDYRCREIDGELYTYVSKIGIRYGDKYFYKVDNWSDAGLLVNTDRGLYDSYFVEYSRVNNQRTIPYTSSSMTVPCPDELKKNARSGALLYESVISADFSSNPIEKAKTFVPEGATVYKAEGSAGEEKTIIYITEDGIYNRFEYEKDGVVVYSRTAYTNYTYVMMYDENLNTGYSMGVSIAGGEDESLEYFDLWRRQRGLVPMPEPTQWRNIYLNARMFSDGIYPNYIDVGLDFEETVLEKMYVDKKEMTRADFVPEGAYLLDYDVTADGDASIVYMMPDMVLYLLDYRCREVDGELYKYVSKLAVRYGDKNIFLVDNWSDSGVVRYSYTNQYQSYFNDYKSYTSMELTSADRQSVSRLVFKNEHRDAFSEKAYTRIKEIFAVDFDSASDPIAMAQRFAPEGATVYKAEGGAGEEKTIIYITEDGLYIKGKYTKTDVTQTVKYREVKVLRKFFADMSDDSRRWDYIEQYFLGYDVLREAESISEEKVSFRNFIDKDRSYAMGESDTWDAVEFLFDENAQSIIKEFVDHQIPMPDYLTTLTKHDILTGDIVMAWADENVIIFSEAISESDATICEKKGWKAFELFSVNVKELGEILTKTFDETI